MIDTVCIGTVFGTNISTIFSTVFRTTLMEFGIRQGRSEIPILRIKKSVANLADF
jgi:hypothetical protein